MFSKKQLGYDFSFDIWSLGIFMYELVVGDPPFGYNDSTIEEMNALIQRGEIDMKEYFSKDFINLLNRLLERDVKLRITVDEIPKHPFFKKIDWTKL